MAYNYFPQTYQVPAYYPTQSNAYPTQQSVGANANALIWVQGEGAAKSYPVAPNTSVPLWDSEANVIYIKSADASGMPNIKVLDYTVRDSTARGAENQHQSDFVTKEELSAIQKEVDALKAKLERRKDDRNGK